MANRHIYSVLHKDSNRHGRGFTSGCNASQDAKTHNGSDRFFRESKYTMERWNVRHDRFELSVRTPDVENLRFRLDPVSHGCDTRDRVVLLREK